jgi:ABC-2 type transport system ATP-binding protein
MVKVENLVKRYGHNYALNDISFEIGEGEIVGLLGPNGAGKSTTMNILTGYLSSTSGAAYIDGINILEHPIEAKSVIGFLPEQPPLYLDMTVIEYLNFVFSLKNCKFNREKHIAEICDIVKIKDVQKRVIRNLSKGYRQRVGIAQALVGNPEVIIFDEPTVGLDPKQVIEVRNLVRTLGKDHTVILSTHILQEVQAVCDRIIIVNKGKLVADEKTENITRTVEQNRRYTLKICGPQREVLAFLRSRKGIVYAEVQTGRDGDAYCYMIETEVGVDIRKNLFYALAEKNWPLIGLEALGMSLEDIFLSIVDHADNPFRNERSNKNARGRARAEKDMASDILKRTREARESDEGDEKDRSVNELFQKDDSNT